MKKIIARSLILIVLVLGGYLYLSTPEVNNGIGAQAQVSFPRPNYFELFVTNEMGEYTQPLSAPSGRIYITQIKHEGDVWAYYFPNGTKSYLPYNIPTSIFWGIDKDGNLIEATVWIDEYGVWIDMRLFDIGEPI